MLDLTRPPARPLVAASILSADFGRIAEECRDVLDRGADLLHVDVMDGHFVPNLTLGADMVRALRKHFPDVFIDAHLMVERPGEFVTMFADAGTNLLSFHLEVTTALRPHGEDADSLIDRIKSAGMLAGMVVTPPTAIEPMAPFLDHLHLVLVMSVNPGRSGQTFIADVLPKARWVRRHVNSSVRVEIDGGINPHTAREAAAAGCDVLVTASALFGAKDRAAVIRQLHEAGHAGGSAPRGD